MVGTLRLGVISDGKSVASDGDRAGGKPSVPARAVLTQGDSGNGKGPVSTEDSSYASGEVTFRGLSLFVRYKMNSPFAETWSCFPLDETCAGTHSSSCGKCQGHRPAVKCPAASEPLWVLCRESVLRPEQNSSSRVFLCTVLTGCFRHPASWGQGEGPWGESHHNSKQEVGAPGQSRQGGK